MRTCKDKQFDLAIVDPPYGLNIDKKNNSEIKLSDKSATKSKYYGNQEWDNNVPDENYFNELFRISKNQIIWGVNYYPYNFLSGGRIYWNKKVTMPTYSSGELAYCSLQNNIKQFDYEWHGMLQQDMKNKEFRIHPTQKPVALYKWLLSHYAHAGDRIIDTHLGSGSSRIACHDMGFDFVGIEIDKDYFEAEEKRYSDHVSQLDLIKPEEIQQLQFAVNK
jgi:site-specific DNA-methyltransferase (adenine-specific)